MPVDCRSITNYAARAGQVDGLSERIQPRRSIVRYREYSRTRVGASVCVTGCMEDLFMLYSVVRIEEVNNNNDRVDAGEERHWLDLIGKMPDVRIEKVKSARDALARGARREDDKLIACVHLIHEDMELNEAIDNARASG